VQKIKNKKGERKVMKKFKVFALVFAIMLSATGLGLLFGSNQPASTQAKVSAAETTNADWYKDWDYTEAPNGNWGISLIAYHGSETTYTVPAEAAIDGEEYPHPIIFGIGSSNYDAQVNLGTITSLSFEPGVSFPEDSSHLFYGSQLTSLNLTGVVDTNRITDMSYMFSGCSSLTDLDLTGFDTSSCIYMGIDSRNDSGMFTGCSALESLDLSKFDTSNVDSMCEMFSGCSSLTSLDLSNFNTSSCYSMGDYNINGVGMFSNCSSLKSITFSSGFDTSNVGDMSYMFYGCSALTNLNLSSFNTSNVTGMYSMFMECTSLASITFGAKFDTSIVTDMSSMFDTCSSLTSLDLSNFDTSSVTEMYCMFSDCSSLKSLDLSSFNTSNVTNMGCGYGAGSGMFYGCSSLTNITFGAKFNTSNVTDMSSMFPGCSALTSLDLSKFNTSNVTTMEYMFQSCSSLASLDLSNFDTSKVGDMYGMFNGCSALTSLDLSKLNTSHVWNMNGMFGGCSSLTSLNLSTFDTSKVTNMGGMFFGCTSLQNIKMPNTMNAESDITLSALSLPSQNASGTAIAWYSLASGAKNGTLVVADNKVSNYASNILTIDPNKSYDAINAEVFTPAKPETPSTGVVLDVVLPVASIVLVLASLVAVAFVGKKKKQY
jgi:surface protein